MRRTGAARRLLLSWLVVVAAMAVGDAGPAHGASFTVDATHDAVDAAPGDGVCADATDACTLRAAVMETNALAGADLDLISLPAGTYVLSLAGAGEDASITGDLDISDDLAILGEVSFDGQGDASPVASIISGAEDRVVEVHPSLTAYFLGVRISGGSASAVPVARGGGMANRGRLTLETVRLEENSASEGGGLWIAAGASAHVLHSTITENRAAGIGAGLGAGVLNEGELILESTTVDGNVAEAGPCEDTVAGICPAPSGGGIANLGSGTATNTTISGNSASAGGGIVNYEALELVNVTVTDNSANTGAGVFNARGTGEFSTIVRQRNTIVSAQASGQDCSGPIDSLGHNLDSDGTCGFTGQGDLPNADPLLGPLTDNGGPTQTHALLAGSPAIDAGDNAACPATDQRGVSRPQDGDGNGSAVCDVGAYEAAAAPTATPAAPTSTPAQPSALPPTGGRGSDGVLAFIVAFALPALGLLFLSASRVLRHQV